MTRTYRTILSVSLGLITVVTIIALVAPDSQGQTEPPAFGLGNWTVSDVTVVEDDFVLMEGKIRVTSGGDLTLRNVTIIFKCDWSEEHGLTIDAGGALRVENSTLGSSRRRVLWTFNARWGSTLSILDSTVQECAGLFISTNDAIIERNAIEGGLMGLNMPSGAPPVRNCTFSFFQVSGVVTKGTWVVDCTFVGQTHFGIRVKNGTPRIIRCTFRDTYSTGVYLGAWGAVIIDCSFEDSKRGVWAEGRCLPSRIENCTFERVENAVSIGSGYLEIVNGRFFNCSEVIDSHGGSRIDWTVTERAIVVGGNISLSGDIVLRDGARLDCIDCIQLAQWNQEAIPLTITLGKDSTLKLVRTALKPPEPNDLKPWIPDNCLPLVIQGDEATLSLVDVRDINLRFPVRLGNLICQNSRLPLGSWAVQNLDLVDSLLYADPAGDEAVIQVTGRLGPTGQIEAGNITRCELDGIPSIGSSGPWLDIIGGRFISRDTLYDLQGWLASGGIRLPVNEDVASIESYWSMKVTVVWQSQTPIPSQKVAITNGEGAELSVVAGPDGNAYATDVLTEAALAAGRLRSLLPFTYSVNMTGLTGKTVLERVSGPVEVMVLVKDMIRPTLMVDQGRFLATNRSTLTITGKASDAHSGLAFIEEAFQRDRFRRVDVSPDNGTFSFEIEFSQSYQTVVIHAYDWVGNRAVWMVVIYYSQREPDLTIHEPVNGSWVNTELVLIAGVTDPNSTVEVGGRLQYTENGTFILLVPLVDGLNILSVLSTNMAGNSNVMSLELFLDTEPPLLEIIEPLDKHIYTRNASEVISGRAEPGSTVQVNTVLLFPDVDGSFSATTSLDQGSSLFIVQAVDRAGNRAVAEIVFVLDSVPPELSVVIPPEEGLRTNRTSVTLELQTDMVSEKDGKPTGDVLIVNGDAITVTETDVKVVLQLVEGVNEVTVRVMDATGNLQEVTRTVWVDTTPPALELVGEYPHTTTDAYLTVRGRTEPGTIVIVNGLHTQVEDNGTFSLTVLLGSGTNVIDVVAEDAFGNSASVDVRIDMMPTSPEPNESEVAWYPILLVIATVVLVAEGIFLKLRSKGAEKEAR